MNYSMIVWSILLSIIFMELTGFTPAGFVVPGYFALSVSSPSRIFYTILIALLSFIIVKLLGNVIILYGKRLFSVTVIVSVLLNVLLMQITVLSTPHIIGGILAGLVAREFDRQGVWQTILALGVVMGLVLAVAAIPGAATFAGAL